MDNIIGIIGGGQLGKMLLQYCSTISLKTYVYDPSENAPCKNLCNAFYTGSLMDYDKILEFGRKCMIVTYEIEHINIDALKTLENEGITVYPSPSTLGVIQNKYTQKCFFTDNTLPTSHFYRYTNLQDIKSDIAKNKIELPCVWKKTTFGYDGFGVKIIKSISDLDSLDNGECIIEDYVNIHKELSVIVARNPSNEFKSYPPVEMIFNENSNQVEFVIEPADISSNILKEVMKIANAISIYLNHVGLLAIELFLTTTGEILINELAPRPHNSGHLTIESCCPTSQFEQHIRSILNFPLGETAFTDPAIMINLVGEEGYYGKALYKGIDSVFNSKDTYLHIYGKSETRPNRKMGHITIVGGNYLLDRAKKLKENIKIIV